MSLRSSLTASAFLVASVCMAQQPDTPNSYPARVSAPLQIAQRTDVPGGSLRPGTYSIRVADSLQDRVILEVSNDSDSSHPAATFLGYPSPALDTTGTSGAVPFSSGLKGKPALRGYAFPSGLKVEFVYPKADAVALAKANSVRVMAVDPASEGKVSLPHLSQQDLNEVTLWLLTPTPVDPTNGGKPGIQAAKYQPPVPQSQPSTVAQNDVPPSPAAQPSSPAQTADAAPAVTASAALPPAPDAPAVAQSSLAPAPASADASAPTSSAPATPAQSSANAPVQMASNAAPPAPRRPRQLPHTASDEPLIWLAGLLSLGLAATLTLRRRSASEQRAS